MVVLFPAEPLQNCRFLLGYLTGQLLIGGGGFSFVHDQFLQIFQPGGCRCGAAVLHPLPDPGRLLLIDFVHLHHPLQLRSGQYMRAGVKNLSHVVEEKLIFLFLFSFICAKMRVVPADNS